MNDPTTSTENSRLITTDQPRWEPWEAKTDEEWQAVAERASEMHVPFKHPATMPSYVVDAILATKPPSKAIRTLIGDEGILMTEDQLQRLANAAKGGAWHTRKRLDVIERLPQMLRDREWWVASTATKLRWLATTQNSGYMMSVEDACAIHQELRRTYPSPTDKNGIRVHVKLAAFLSLARRAIEKLPTWSLDDYVLSAKQEVEIITNDHLWNLLYSHRSKLRHESARLVWDVNHEVVGGLNSGQSVHNALVKARKQCPEPTCSTELLLRYLYRFRLLNTEPMTPEDWLWLAKGTRNPKQLVWIAEHLDVMDLL